MTTFDQSRSIIILYFLNSGFPFHAIAIASYTCIGLYLMMIFYYTLCHNFNNYFIIGNSNVKKCESRINYYLMAGQ